ncbi:uncharacterized protein K444DRAFT_667755 [Hyaloscypha bicolor E]|uniref:Uncharacterized protein n=1 Tax=Hyaloscypha bicolor E TaxID=1095630 RepID=A0A2J6STP6_9HELO|nr:uncharacterized protein K444DRAFT_667755 [Hyaloscypha bicolor E]PMD54129.1 hypothetical protein K444DRAFT_667755 [Hyaloscypha bicolor E]
MALVAMNSTSNITLPCSSFSSLTDLVVAATRAQINITLEVQKCPGLCLLAWGTGNPDLSGVGTNISWLFQALLTVLFCPLLRVYLQLASSDKVKNTEKVEVLLQDTHKEFLGATILIALSVLVATIVYVRHSHPIFEVTFLYYLATMQFLALLGTALSALQFCDWDVEPQAATSTDSTAPASGPVDGTQPAKGRRRPNLEKQRGEVEKIWEKWTEQPVITTVACIIGFGLYLGCLSWIRGQSISLSFLPELASSCSTYGRIVPHIPPATSPAPKINWGLLHHMWTHIRAPGNFFVCLIFVLIILCAVAAVLFLAYLAFATLVFLLVNPYSNSLFTLAFAIGVLFFTGQMQVKRNNLKKVVGKQYTDGEWGFGQIVAIFVWMPTTLRLIARWVEIAPACRRKKPSDVEKGNEPGDEKGKPAQIVCKECGKKVEEIPPAALTENEPGAKRGDQEGEPGEETKGGIQTDSREISETPPAAPAESLEDKPLENLQEETPKEAPQDDSERSQEAKIGKNPNEESYI